MASDVNQMNRLCEKTQEDLNICEQKINNWTKFIDDYKSLEERLSTIADKTTHEVMVPIAGSDLAFMPGFIRHTNEILVLLGDNYFVERSAKEAKDIVQRRLNKCHKMLDELNKEKTHLEKWLEFSQQISSEKQSEEFVEIIEPFDEQKEKQWREEHRQRLRQHMMSQKETHNQSDDSDINTRLERLEIEENDSQKRELKSILKKEVKSQDRAKSVVFDDNIQSVNTSSDANERQIGTKNNDRLESVVEETQETSETIAFTNQIKERDVKESQTIGEVPQSEPKRVSRFKASRLQK